MSSLNQPKHRKAKVSPPASEAENYEQALPFLQPAQSVSALMWTLVLALLPGVVTSIYLFGIGLILQFCVALITVLITDELVKKLNPQAQRVVIQDGTAVVLAIIVAISMPPIAPWWVCAAASIVANIFGKHIYGGAGHNLFNPAMVGVAFALICFPTVSTYWPNGGLVGSFSTQEIFRAVFFAQTSQPDAISGATLLEYERTQLSFAMMRGEFSHTSQYGLLAEKGWQWVNLAYFVGGLLLCVRRVIPWVVPVAVLGTVFVFASIFNGLDGTRYAGPLFHCFSGAIIFCAFFVATDPVTSPAGQRALLIYAILIGVLVFFFRHASGYPEGVAFAVILANALTPLLDRLCAQRIYGH